MHINTKMQKQITGIFEELQHHDNLCPADKLHWLQYIKTNLQMTEALVRGNIDKENVALSETLSQE